MKSTEILAKELNDHLHKKYDGEVIVSYISFTHSYGFDNYLLKFGKKFEISVSLKFQTMDDLSSWNAPRIFQSKISFENACEMAKIALDGYMESILFERDINENGLPNHEIRVLLNTPISHLNSEEFDKLINYFAQKEDYNKAHTYKMYKEKYNNEE